MLCRTRDSNPHQRCAGLFSRMLYQLSYWWNSIYWWKSDTCPANMMELIHICLMILAHQLASSLDLFSNYLSLGWLYPGLLWKKGTESDAGSWIRHIRSNLILAAHWPYQVVNKMLPNWIWYVCWVTYSCMQHHVHRSESPPLCWGRFHFIFHSVKILAGDFLLLTIQLFVVVLSQAPLTLVAKSSKIWCRQLAQTNNPTKQKT